MIRIVVFIWQIIAMTWCAAAYAGVSISAETFWSFMMAGLLSMFVNALHYIAGEQ